MNNRKKGSQYEQIAGEYLKLQGYEVLEYNFRCRFGEIDIVAKDGESLVFCEVKYRKNEETGNPLEAVTFAKQKKISQTAFYYVTIKNKESMTCRFDVIGILGNEIQHIKNAFEYIG